MLFTHIVSSYGAGLPAALLFAIVLKLGAQSLFVARALEELVKLFVFLWRYRTPSWYRKSVSTPTAASSE